MNSLNRFNWIARSYDSLVEIVFGEQLLEAQLHFLSFIKSGDRVLIMGGGSGKFLERLIKLNSDVQILYVEASSEMISMSRKSVPAELDITFLHGTQDDIRPDCEFDVVITNFFLDLFSDDELNRVISKVSSHLRPSGIWLVTDFRRDGKLQHQILLKLMYLFFRLTGSIRVTTLPRWRETIASGGFRFLDEKLFVKEFVSSVVAKKINA